MSKPGFISLAAVFAFLLGSYEGYVALWKGCDPDPYKVFPYSVASLPPADQRALAEGIRIEDEKALIQLLEDYLS